MFPDNNTSPSTALLSWISVNFAMLILLFYTYHKFYSIYIILYREIFKILMIKLQTNTYFEKIFEIFLYDHLIPRVLLITHNYHRFLWEISTVTILSIIKQYLSYNIYKNIQVDSWQGLRYNWPQSPSRIIDTHLSKLSLTKLLFANLNQMTPISFYCYVLLDKLVSIGFSNNLLKLYKSYH